MANTGFKSVRLEYDIDRRQYKAEVITEHLDRGGNHIRRTYPGVTRASVDRMNNVLSNTGVDNQYYFTKVFAGETYIAMTAIRINKATSYPAEREQR